MPLGREKVIELIKKGELKIEPFEENLLEDFTYNLRIGEKVYVFDKHLVEAIDLEKDFSRYVEVFELKNSFVIHSGETVFVETLEKIKMPKNIMGLLHPKAKLPMIGIVILTGGGKIDPGFEGKLIIGITNFGGVPIKIKKGMKIAQISFWELI